MEKKTEHRQAKESVWITQLAGNRAENKSQRCLLTVAHCPEGSPRLGEGGQTLSARTRRVKLARPLLPKDGCDP